MAVIIVAMAIGLVLGILTGLLQVLMKPLLNLVWNIIKLPCVLLKKIITLPLRRKQNQQTGS